MTDKVCWNVCCICWVEDSSSFNCNAEDLSPGVCKLSHLNLKPMLEVAKEVYASENNAIGIKGAISQLESIKAGMEEKLEEGETDPTVETLRCLIEKLKNR